MKHSYTFVGVVAATVATIVLAADSAAWGEEKHSFSSPREGAVSSMSRFYGGSNGRIGNFPGKLVCLRCDIQPGPNAMAQCEKAGHRHALSMDGDAMIHPLLAGTQPVLQRINSGELHGKEVTVHGRYYPATNAILVDQIEEKK